MSSFHVCDAPAPSAYLPRQALLRAFVVSVVQLVIPNPVAWFWRTGVTNARRGHASTESYREGSAFSLIRPQGVFFARLPRATRMGGNFPSVLSLGAYARADNSSSSQWTGL